MAIIIKPIVTEKMTAMADKLNRYGFAVCPDANKQQIKKAVEEMYNVTVVDCKYNEPQRQEEKPLHKSWFDRR